MGAEREGTVADEARRAPGFPFRMGRVPPPGVLAWLAPPMLMGAILLLWTAGFRGMHESLPILALCNGTFTVVGSAVVAYLVVRTFLADGSPGLLFLGCGMALLGGSGVLASLLNRGNPNTLITVHNLMVSLSGTFHLVGALYRPRGAPVPRPYRALALGCAAGAVLAGVLLVAWSTLAGWTVPFFVQGEGGTFPRQMILITTMASFATTAVVMGRTGALEASPFGRWYSLALWLNVAGLLGVLLQHAAGSALCWTGRASLYLGSLYMTLAALAPTRMPAGAWNGPTPAPFRYGAAILAVTLSASLQLPFRPLGESGLSFLLFIPASGVAALYGGLGPGLLATTLSAILVTVLPLGPQGWSRAHVPPGAGLGLFLVSCLIIVLATEGLHRAQTRALAAEAESREAAERSRGEAALRATVEELTRTNRELEQFAYVASHDLQEPLRMVRAYAGLLADRYGTALDDKGCQYLAFVREGAGRMTLLIEDLLQYSRLGSRLSRQSSVDLAACASEAVRSLAGMIQENDARILLDPLPPVKGDPTLLTQVFLNLLSNALKFRSDRRPEIRLGCRDIAGEKAVFVQDNGIGLDPGNAARIFEIFQRLHPRERYPGTGIGLCICRKIVESHGGRIWVESAPGEGSTFLFTLPGAPVAP